MALFAQLRGRIGAAGLVLRSYPPESSMHQAQSEVQAAAVLSVLRSQGNQLTADEKARLSSMIAASAFAEKDALEMVAFMSDLSTLLRRLKDNAAALQSFDDSYRALTEDYHANFDMVVCRDQFAYTAEPQNGWQLDLRVC